MCAGYAHGAFLGGERAAGCGPPLAQLVTLSLSVGGALFAKGSDPLSCDLRLPRSVASVSREMSPIYSKCSVVKMVTGKMVDDDPCGGACFSRPQPRRAGSAYSSMCLGFDLSRVFVCLKVKS